MEVDTPEFIDSALLIYHAEVRKAITAQETRLEQLQVAHDQLQETINCVQQLPSKLRHQVMVPYGKHAFFPGHLTRTNELTAHLGDQYYVETTAGKAQGILQRKLAVLAQGISKGQQQLQSLQARLDVTNSSLKDGSVSEPAFEIRSSVEESDALLASVKRSSAAGGAAATRQQQSAAAQAADDVGYKALQSRLEELIKLEAQMEAEDELQQWTDRQQLQHGLTTIAEGDEGTSKTSQSLDEAGGSSSSGSGAFTGMVMERSGTEQPPGAAGTASGLLLSDVQERQSVPAASRGPLVASTSTGQPGNIPATSSSTRPSKFKLQRMGL
eukprot:gene8449-8633_t